MSKMIQIRNVPDALHEELTRRARLREQTLSDYLQHVLRREVATPPVEEVIARIERSEPVTLPGSVAELIRADREERDLELLRRVAEGRDARYEADDSHEHAR